MTQTHLVGPATSRHIVKVSPRGGEDRDVHRRLTVLIVPVLVALSACTPPAPSNTRYVNKVFDLVTETRDVRYATAPALITAVSVDLDLDVFQPAGDTATSRPAI